MADGGIDLISIGLVFLQLYCMRSVLVKSLYSNFLQFMVSNKLLRVDIRLRVCGLKDNVYKRCVCIQNITYQC